MTYRTASRRVVSQQELAIIPNSGLRTQTIDSKQIREKATVDNQSSDFITPQHCASQSKPVESAAVQQGEQDPEPTRRGQRGQGMALNGNGSKRLHGKVSIITGGGQGIGRATAIKFAHE